MSRTMAQREHTQLNTTVTLELSAQEGEAAIVPVPSAEEGKDSAFVAGAMATEDDVNEDGSIVLYARDYREMGRWVPRDTSYIIGRYMYETDSLPRPWVNHCNQLDEVWVPSQWQRKAFLHGGVRDEKMQVMGETVDEYFFDPHAVDPLALPGTTLDGHPPPNSPSAASPASAGSGQEEGSSGGKRPFAFCAVFKMEDRKGYKELVEGYIREFANNSDVVLVLRTYIHSGQGISDENFSPYLIRQ